MSISILLLELNRRTGYAESTLDMAFRLVWEHYSHHYLQFKPSLDACGCNWWCLNEKPRNEQKTQ